MTPSNTLAAVPPQTQKILTDEERQIVDRYGVLYVKSRAWAPEKKEFERLGDTIQDWFSGLPANKTARAVGDSYTVQIGERRNVYSWASISALQKAVGGWLKLRALWNPPFTAVEAVLGKKPAQALQVHAQTGWRPLEAVVILSVPCARILTPEPDPRLAVELPKAA